MTYTLQIALAIAAAKDLGMTTIANVTPLSKKFQIKNFNLIL